MKYFKRKWVSIVTAGVMAGAILTGCGASSGSGQQAATQESSTAEAAASDTSDAAQSVSSEEEAEKNVTETAAGTASTSADASSGSRSLIVYFDYSENMGDTSGMTVDAITSASLAGQSYDGITKNDLLVMRDEIQEQTGADVFSVRVTEPYDPDYNNMVGVAQEDQNNNKQFTFVEELPDLSDYDTIYMGMPVWWGGLPQPMVSFLDQNDFSGKTIIPFGIHLGSRFGRMISQIEEAEPDATVDEDGLTENSHTPNAQVVSDVDAWLSGK